MGVIDRWLRWEYHYQNVFLCMALAPPSSYSRLDTHIRLNVSRDANIDPPIHVEYILSWGADIWKKELPCLQPTCIFISLYPLHKIQSAITIPSLYHIIKHCHYEMSSSNTSLSCWVANKQLLIVNGSINFKCSILGKENWSIRSVSEQGNTKPWGRYAFYFKFFNKIR